MIRLALSLCAAAVLPATSQEPLSPALLPQEPVLKGLQATNLNLKSPLDVFAAVFAQLPPEVLVMPTENYYYWRLFAGGREIRGNIRLPSGQREKGTLCIGYAEFDEFPDDGGPVPEISESQYLNAANGVAISCPTPFSSEVIFRGKTVRFRFLQLDQRPLEKSQTAPGEVFVSRTCDESGCRFILMYNTRKKSFHWVLDEASAAMDHWQPILPDCTLGRRTGFLLWTDKSHGNRRILAAVRGASVRRNDWFDGPFDQLADNYADQTNIRKWMEDAMPGLRGRIDKWGYLTDSPTPERIALNPYGTWESVDGAVDFLRKAEESGDPLLFFAKIGKNP